LKRSQKSKKIAFDPPELGCFALGEGMVKTFFAILRLFLYAKKARVAVFVA
jgi:hypothetical protein